MLPKRGSGALVQKERRGLLGRLIPAERGEGGPGYQIGDGGPWPRRCPGLS